MRKPYRVYGGLQDNGSWGGPSRTRIRRRRHRRRLVSHLGADGFYCQADPNDADTVYCEGQYGDLQRVNVRLGGETSTSRRSPPTKQTPAYRFNWNSPILISPHDSKTIYYGGNFVFKSVNRGDTGRRSAPT